MDHDQIARDIALVQQEVLLGLSPEEFAAWLDRPAPAFEGKTARQLIEQGDVDRVRRAVYGAQQGIPL